MARATFNISDELDELTYDFRPYVPEAFGTIPEPTEDAIKLFRKRMRRTVGKDLLSMAEAPESEREAQIEAAVKSGSVTEELLNEKLDNVFKATAAVCSNKPSYEEIKALPWRGQRIFVGWVIGNLLNPKSQTADTKD